MSDEETLAQAVREMSPAAVGEWLSELNHPLFPNDCEKCLFAEYLSDTTNLPVRVTGSEACIYRGGSVRLPDWAIRLIHSFDIVLGSSLRKVSSQRVRWFFSEWLKDEARS